MGSIQYNKANRCYLKDMIKNGLDGIRFFCDDGYDQVNEMIEDVRSASE